LSIYYIIYKNKSFQINKKCKGKPEVYCDYLVPIYKDNQAEEEGSKIKE